MIHVPLHGKNAVGLVALVDDEDAERVAPYRWYRHSRGYAIRSLTFAGRSTTTSMHRLVMGLGFGDPLQVDHKNLNKLDNRRSNLRLCTSALNQQNKASVVGSSSKYRGVTWDARRGRWRVQVQVDRHNSFGGFFADEDEAGRSASALRAELMPFTIEASASWPT